MNNAPSDKKDNGAVADALSRSREANRATWYTPAAEAYARARPTYPDELIDRVAETARFNASTLLLEIGCGPGTATLALAQRGIRIEAVEPNAAFCEIARKRCEPFPNVKIFNTTFEEISLKPQHYDVVLSASAFHWVSPEIGYPKAATALKDSGYFVLLWNMPPQPEPEVSASFKPVYQRYAPELDRYESREAQEQLVDGLGQPALDSGLFRLAASEKRMVERRYSADDYLALMTSNGDYLKLAAPKQQAVLEGLRNSMREEQISDVCVSFVSACQIYQKMQGPQK